MAAAGAAFSIREYAARARARAEGGGGSWPFGGDAGPLPPLEVRRFRWWQDEAAKVEEEEVEVERRMAAKRRKRSVAELFAAVPRVPRGGGGGGGQGSGNKGKKAAKRKAAEKDKGKLVLAVSVKTKKKKKVPAGIGVREKEKNSGVKVTSVTISKSFQLSTKKREPKNSSCKKKEKQEVSVLLDKKSKKGNRKSVLERHKTGMTNNVQAQSICKNQSKAGLITGLNTTDMRCKSNFSCKSKHVTFSDGTVKFRRTAHLPEENTKQPQSVQTIQQPSQEGRDHHNTDEQQLVYQQAEAISGPVETTSSLSENLVPAGVCHTIPLTKPKDITIMGNSVDLNHCIETSHGSNCLNSTRKVCLSSKVPSQSFKGVDSHLNGDNSLSVDVECLGEQNHMVSQTSFNPVSLAAKAISGDRSPLSQPSGSCLSDRSRSTFQDRAVAFGKVSSELLRSSNMVRSISSTGSNKPAQTADCISACWNNHNRDDYVGLPINSRGEFVKVHPGATPNSVDIFRRQCLGENSSCPSASQTVVSPLTCTDHVNLRPSYHARQTCAIDQSVLHADTRFTPTAPMAYGMDVRQLPSSERTNIHYYTIPSNKYPCSKQKELSMECFCSECLGHHNPQQKLLGMRNHCLSQNFGQDTQHNAETTMRLMGKTVTLGTSSIHCRRLNNGTSCSSKQSQAEDQFFQGTRTKVFPQLFHGGLVDPPSACRISDGERQPSGNPSHFPFIPAAVRAPITTRIIGCSSGFRTSAHNKEPELATANNPYVQPVDWRNESELGNQQPVMANQVQSDAENMLLGSIHWRHTQTLAPESSFNTRSSVRNFMGKGPASYQSSYLTQQFSNIAPRTVASSFASGYAAQKTPGLITQTKFTSLRPLPPSVIPSHVYSAEYAPPPHGTVATFYPPVAIPYPASNSSAPGGAIFGIERMRWTMTGSRPEGLEHLRNCKRPAEKDDLSMALPKKPCTAAQKGQHMLPSAETGLESRGSRPDAPICLDDEAEADLRLGNREFHPTWSKAVSTMRPVMLKPGAKHVQQPSASSVYQENPWPAHSVTPLAPEE